MLMQHEFHWVDHNMIEVGEHGEKEKKNERNNTPTHHRSQDAKDLACACVFLKEKGGVSDGKGWVGSMATCDGWVLSRPFLLIILDDCREVSVFKCALGLWLYPIPNVPDKGCLWSWNGPTDMNTRWSWEGGKSESTLNKRGQLGHSWDCRRQIPKLHPLAICKAIVSDVLFSL